MYIDANVLFMMFIDIRISWRPTMVYIKCASRSICNEFIYPRENVDRVEAVILKTIYMRSTAKKMDLYGNEFTKFSTLIAKSRAYKGKCIEVKQSEVTS